MQDKLKQIKILSISPDGDLHTMSVYATQENSRQAIQHKKIIHAFHSDQSEGLIFLAGICDANHLPLSLMFWRDFATQYANALCQQSSMDTTQIKSMSPPSAEILDKFVLGIPPIPGAEYCTRDMLVDTWERLGRWVSSRVKACKNGWREFITHYLPRFSSVGRVCFHLAENKNHSTHPFAFLVTYASHLGNHSKIKHQPLSRALKEYAGQQNKQALANLLKPVYEASKQCYWVKSLIDNADIYHPLAWTAEEAYTLLKTVPALEASGIVVRLPNWWKKRARPKVQVTIGDQKKNTLDMNALLDFNVDVMLDDLSLTKAELDGIFTGAPRLVSIRGQWVEVAPQQLKEALTHWETMKQNVTDGQISFIEGMRLLAGTNSDLVPLLCRASYELR